MHSVFGTAFVAGHQNILSLESATREALSDWARVDPERRAFDVDPPTVSRRHCLVLAWAVGPHSWHELDACLDRYALERV